MGKIVLCGMVILVSMASSSLFGLHGFYQRKLADAQESFSVFDFQDADSNYSDAEKYLNYGRNIPGLLNSELISIKNRRSEVRYWLGRYDDLISDFYQGNALYRILETEKDKAKVIGLLDSAISKYAEAIDGDTSNLNAAFNYEYLLQLKNDISNGKRKLPLKQQVNGQSMASNKGDRSGQDGNIHGQEGAQPMFKETDKILIHVPTSGDESREKGSDSGKGEIKRKKG